MRITKEVWRQISDVLERNKISYTTHLESRDIQRSMACPDITVHDKHIQINVVIPDYFEEG